MDDRKIFVTLSNGEEKEMEIYFTFDDDQRGKSYVLFFDPQDKEGTVYAMSYDEEGNLEAVETEEEWEMIEEVYEGFNDANLEE